MPRLRNSETGVTINVSDDKAKRLGHEWQPVQVATRRRARKAESGDDSE